MESPTFENRQANDTTNRLVWLQASETSLPDERFWQPEALVARGGSEKRRAFEEAALRFSVYGAMAVISEAKIAPIGARDNRAGENDEKNQQDDAAAAP